MDDTVDGFGHWFAGFTAGEGSFNISKNGRGARFCVFRIGLHVDDAPILYEVANRLEMGRVVVGETPSSGWRALWTVQRKSECLRLVELFERYPLRAKKQRDFEVWAEAVRLWQGMVYTSQHAAVKNDWTSFDELRQVLMTGRRQRGRKAWVV
jgi:hypothetical protein